MKLKKISILSLFPQMILEFFNYGIIRRAKKNIQINAIDLRDWGIGKRKQVDDLTFGFGPGMLLKPDIVNTALNNIDAGYVVHVSPRGIPLDSKKVKELAKKEHLILIASRYEGLDQRVIDNYIDEEISIGDYILSGGELASLVIIDTILRMDSDILRTDAVEDESFQQGLLEYSHYTKPIIFESKKVPDYLRSGNHELIKNKRFQEQLYITWKNRKDLFREYPLCRIKATNKNSLIRIKKQNLLLKERLNALEKIIQEHKDV